MKTNTWLWIGIILLSILLIWEACGNSPGERGADPVKFWHEALQRTVKRAKIKDKAFEDSINRLSKVRNVYVSNMRTKYVQIQPKIVHITNDTIRELAYIIQDCDSIITQDSVLINLWHSRFDNQKAFSDSLETSIPVLDSIYRVELKQSNREGNKKFWRGFLWGFGSGYFTGRLTP